MYREIPQNEPLPHTRTDPTLNDHINEIIQDFYKLVGKAKSYGLDIKLTPNSKTSLDLFFHDDYPDTILVDKLELEIQNPIYTPQQNDTEWNGDMCDA